MPGVTGGSVDNDSLLEMRKELEHEEWYGAETTEDGPFGLSLVHHDERDPNGHDFCQGDRWAGGIYGAATSDELPTSDSAETFERVLDDPERALSSLDGSFSLVAFDSNDDRFVLATDKLGTRPLFYSVENGLLFGSELKSVLTQLDSPRTNEQAVNDLVTIGGMWGDETLVEGVYALPPGTALVYDNGEANRIRYWRPRVTASAEPGDAYTFELVTAYQDAIAEMTETLDSEVGLWLSGGLDSRAMATELNRHVGDAGPLDPPTAYTYDANPAGGGNPQLARRVADSQNFGIEDVPLTGERFAEVLDTAVSLTDGMLAWNSLINLSAVFDLPDDSPGIILEAAGQGELLGEHPRRSHITNAATVAESMYKSETPTMGDSERVQSLLNVDVDPTKSFKEAARRSEGDTFEAKVLDSHYQNHYTRFVYMSNQMARCKVGTRVPFANGDFLDCVSKLPLKYRLGSLPFSDGKLLYGTSIPKLRLIRSLDADLAEIPYQRTRLSPKRPYPAHIFSYLASNGLDYLRSKPVMGGRTLADEWYLNSPPVRERVNELIDGACDRRFFDADELRDLQAEHLDGESFHTGIIAPVTTLEIWLQKYLD